MKPRFYMEEKRELTEQEKEELLIECEADYEEGPWIY